MPKQTARRLLVTGHNSAGRSCVASDTIVSGNEMPNLPGTEINLIWGSDEVMRYPDKGGKPAYTSFFPPISGCRMVEMYMPGQSAGRMETAGVPGAKDALDAAMPGLSATLDEDRPGMHRSATMDMGVIIEGRCVLQLDDGEVTLTAGDVLVQSGTMHAWSNPFPEPCRFIGVMVGAKIDNG